MIPKLQPITAPLAPSSTGDRTQPPAASADAQPYAADRGGSRRGGSRGRPGRPAKDQRPARRQSDEPETPAALDDQDGSDDADADDSAGAPPVAQSTDGTLTVPPGKTVVIGITGEPGAGKSSLARQLVALGAQLIDVDVLGHDLIETPPVKRRLVEEFGEDILGADGDIERRTLATKAFATPQSTAKLNEIVHPKLSTRAKAAIKKAGNFVVVDAALLHELGLGELCTTTIYVRASRENRINRVGERGWDENQLARREAALGNADARRKACQLAVDNSGDPALLTAFAKTILARQLGVDLSTLRRQPSAETAPAESSDATDDGDDAAGQHEPVVTESRSMRAEAGSEAPPRPPAAPGREHQHNQNQGRPFTERHERQSGNQPHDRHGQDRQDRQDRPDRQGNNPNNPNNQNGPNNQNSQNNPNAPFQPRVTEDPNRPPLKLILDDYLKRILPDLQGEAEKLEVRDVKWLKKHDLICEILRRVGSGRADEILVDGHMEMVKDQHAFIRSALNNYLPVSTDAFVALPLMRRYGLKPGMHVTGIARAPRGNERCPQLISIQTVMGEPVDKRTPVQDFEHLVPLHAFERLFMEIPGDPTDLSLRIIDLVAPIGKGQRGLLVAQPKCGKTVYLQKIAKAISINNPEVVLMVLLVDERPEEVTDMQRSVKGEVIASTFDQHASRHVQCAEMVINKAKRLVEHGKDVVILLDSVTRLARAYNTEAPNSGRILSGGIDSNALIKPKQFFGAARKIENGGSLTILATALVDTGSLMDTVIFEEFKGTGNMELVLDRRLANRRIFPAVDCGASGTRKDELLIKNEDELRRVWALRKFLADRNGQDAIEFLRSKLKNFRTNVEFLLTVDPEKLSGW